MIPLTNHDSRVRENSEVVMNFTQFYFYVNTALTKLLNSYFGTFGMIQYVFFVIAIVDTTAQNDISYTSPVARQNHWFIWLILVMIVMFDLQTQVSNHR